MLAKGVNTPLEHASPSKVTLAGAVKVVAVVPDVKFNWATKSAGTVAGSVKVTLANSPPL